MILNFKYTTNINLKVLTSSCDEGKLQQKKNVSK